MGTAPADACTATGTDEDENCSGDFDGKFGVCSSDQKFECDGTTFKWYQGCDATTECPEPTYSGGGVVMPTNCYYEFEVNKCEPYYTVSAMGMTMGAYIKIDGECPTADDAPCFSREAEACKILDTSASPAEAFRACFDEPALKMVKRVPMTELVGGDYVLSAGQDLQYVFTRVLINQHRLEGQKRSSIVKLTHATGELSLTPDHVLLVDGEWAAARTVTVGSSLSGSTVTAISRGVGGVVNPVTANGLIVAAGPTGGAVVSSAYPEWIAEYMLKENNGVYPLPVSISNGLAYLFPATAQALWDEVLEDTFATNQARLGAAKTTLPTALVAPIILALDLLCAAGLALFALAKNPKALVALAAVAAAALARRAKKA
jgi:hypothetical protein